MPRKQSSSSVSAIAGKYVKMRNMTMFAQVLNNETRFFRDIRKLAASVLSQDETRGQRPKFIRKRPSVDV